MTIDHSIAELMQSARDLESESRLSEAVDMYSKVIAKEPLHAAAYDRLMIVYRKLKEYRKELQLINSAIKAHEDDLKAHQQQFTKANKKAAKISKTLAGKLGLVDSMVYEKEIGKWQKRKVTVEKRLKKK